MFLRKVLLAAFTIAAFSHESNAQFTKGTVMLGTTIGTTGFNSANSNYDYDAGNSKGTTTHTFTLSAGPQAGVFLTNHLVIGVTPSINFSTSHVTTTDVSATAVQTGGKTSTTTTTVTIGPYLRDYFAKLGNNTWMYGQLNAAVGTGSGSSSGNSYSTTNTASTDGKVSGIFNWNAGGSLGLTHFIYKRIGMDISVGYLYSHVHNEDVNNTYTTNKGTGNTAQTSNNYTLNTATNGITFGAGFHWFLKG